MEYMAQEKQILPLIFLIDNSGSMSNCIEELNIATNNMIEVLKDQESLRAEVYVSFITFGSDSKLHTPLTPISSMGTAQFQASGLTPLGGALNIAKQTIENREIIPSNSFRPMVVLLSDGYPTDSYEIPLNNFISDGRSKKCERFSLGIGKDYDLDMLRSFSTNGKVFEAAEAINIIDFFKFITMTIKDKSMSSNPNKTPINLLEEYESTTKKLVYDKVPEEVNLQSDSKEINSNDDAEFDFLD